MDRTKPHGMYVLSILPTQYGFDYVIIRANGCTTSGQSESLTVVLDRIREVLSGEVAGLPGKW